MAKLQRNSFGKLLRNAAGKIIRAVRCCCGQPPVPGCNQIAQPYCDTGSGQPTGPVTLKVTAAGITSGSGCLGEIAGSSEVVSGNVNRVFYVSVIPEARNPPSPTVAAGVWGGWFLTAERSADPSAPDVIHQCDSVDAQPAEFYRVEVRLSDTQEMAVTIVNLAGISSPSVPGTAPL